MRYVLFFALVCCSITVIAQQKTFFGRVTDGKARPVAFAVVQVKDRNLGTYTDDDGIFFFESHPDSVKALLFSCVGFEKKEVRVNASVNDSIIVSLQQIAIEIPEVDIVAKQLPLQAAMLGKNELEYKGQVYFNIGDEMAIFLPAEKKNKRGYLNEVFIYVTRIGIYDSRIRLHVYDIDPLTGKPGKELTTRNIIVNASEADEWMGVTLAEDRIPVQKEGVYIGIEWISGYGNDPKARWRRGLFDYHSPVIGFTQSYGGNHKRYCRLKFSKDWGDGKYKKYKLSPMVFGSFTYRGNN